MAKDLADEYGLESAGTSRSTVHDPDPTCPYTLNARGSYATLLASYGAISTADTVTATGSCIAIHSPLYAES